VKDLSSLVNAVINLSNSVSEISSYYLASCVLELLNNISNVESLSLSYWTHPVSLYNDIFSFHIYIYIYRYTFEK
jgi:hypothetical protein